MAMSSRRRRGRAGNGTANRVTVTNPSNRDRNALSNETDAKNVKPSKSDAREYFTFSRNVVAAATFGEGHI